MVGTTAVSDEVIRPIGCARCGYELRGLRSDGVCPECGLAVSASLADGRLANSDPTYVLNLLRGITIQLWLCLAWAAGAAVQAALGPALRAPIDLTLSLAGCWAVWLLTLPDPRGVEPRPAATRAIWLRGASLTMVGASLLASCAQWFAIRGQPELETGALWVSVVQVSLIIARYRDLAARIPDRRLSGSAWTVQVGLTTCLGLLAVVHTAGLVMGRGSVSLALVLVGLAAIPGGLGALAFGIMGLVLAFRLRAAVARTLVTARSRFAAA